MVQNELNFSSIDSISILADIHMVIHLHSLYLVVTNHYPRVSN